MPIYEYRCLNCGHLFWKLCKVSGKEQAPACPSCNSIKLEKLISGFNTRFYLEKAEDAGREMLKDLSESQGTAFPPPKGRIT